MCEDGLCRKRKANEARRMKRDQSGSGCTQRRYSSRALRASSFRHPPSVYDVTSRHLVHLSVHRLRSLFACLVPTKCLCRVIESVYKHYPVSNLLCLQAYRIVLYHIASHRMASHQAIAQVDLAIMHTGLRGCGRRIGYTGSWLNEL
jgi:hypothetical protein